jgi:hypothetical protein
MRNLKLITAARIAHGAKRIAMSVKLKAQAWKGKEKQFIGQLVLLRYVKNEKSMLSSTSVF